MARLLDTIDQPHALKGLTLAQLRQLAAELRDEIVTTTAQTGGHLGANLGAIEITLALHSVLNSPDDKLIWDVGHQAYAHKLLTGRREAFKTLRQYGGLSGFPKRSESVHDAFGTAHAGTSVSAALGYALARDRRGESHHVVCVTGDGAMTAGMIFEALNHAGQLGTRLVVILNDNEMSISKNVGALSEYLTRVRIDPTVQRARGELEHLAQRLPGGSQVLKAVGRIKDLVEQVLVPGQLFTELGFTYYGPIDGHDIELLQRTLRQSLAKRGPVLIHAITEKGRGYQPAESDPGKLHAVKAATPAKSEGPAKARRAKTPTYSQVFGDALIRLAEGRDDIIAITAAMGPGTGLSGFGERFPDRFFDVGIAEQHAVTLAAGLACGGFRPVAAIYSTFLQRAYDQVIPDVALKILPVLFAIDGAGFAGDDGATHHGAFDIAYLRTVPNFVLMAPKDEAELCRMLATGLAYPGPAAVRYPRGEGVGVPLPERFEPLPIGRGEVVRAGEDLTLFAYGAMVQPALDAAARLSLAGIEARVVNARFAKPLDEALLLECARETGALLTLEEGSLAGGFGAAVLECLSAANALVPVARLGLPDRFVDHGGVGALCAEAGLSVEDVVDSARRLLAQSKADVGLKRSPFRIRRAVGR